MKIEKTEIEGVYLIEFDIFKDNRGELIKPYTFEKYKEIFINLDFKETWFTKSNKDVIRAMHLQIMEDACEKLVSVINGSVIDVVLDTRKDSATFGKWIEIKLDTKGKGKALYIPIGCAHGYKVLEDNTITLYMATKVHSIKNDTGIKYDSFGYDWNIKIPIISEKDKTLLSFEEFKKEYSY